MILNGVCFIEDSCFIQIVLKEMSRHFACLPWGLLFLWVLCKAGFASFCRHDKQVLPVASPCRMGVEVEGVVLIGMRYAITKLAGEGE
ncbi:MAG: hypothetical protein A2W85_05730 [Bacteroidetes bacterium GWF2_41_31]|nr:MAG: hypothetical protein A2W85_05730 [Bacteroidetes bacterium GWF2_41_31]